MRILQVCIYYPPSVGGVENFVKELNHNILALRPDTKITVLCFRRSKGEKKDSMLDGVRVIRLNSFFTISSQPVSPFLTSKIKTILQKEQFDIINFHYPNPLLSNALLRAYRETKCKAKLYVHWHGDIVGRAILSPWYIKSTNSLLKTCDCVTSDTMNYARNSKLLNDYMNKVAVIPAIPNFSILNANHRNLEIEKTIEKMAKGRKIIFSFGRMVKWKGFQYVIKAFKKLDQSKYVLLLGGYGKYEKALKKLGSGNNNIFFVGKIDETTKYSYLTKSNLFVFPSYGRQEAFGICLAEAMYCKSLCLAFDFDDLGAREIAIPGFSCFAAKPLDSDDLAKQIAYCCHIDSSERERITNNAKGIIDEKLSIHYYRKQINLIYFSNGTLTDLNINSAN